MPEFLRRVPPLPAVVCAFLVIALADHSSAGPADRWTWAATSALIAVAAGLVLAARPGDLRQLLPVVGWTAATASFVVNVVAVPYPDAIGSARGTWLYTETAALLALLALTVRWVPGRSGVVLAAALTIADGTLALRFAPLGSFASATVGCLFWSLGAAAAIAYGHYLRILERHKRLAVAATRRAERLDLARDLHDFVAHHISGIVVQAQAAQLVAAADPARALAALALIEDAGSQALESMRTTVMMLRDLDADAEVDVDAAVVDGASSAARSPSPGLKELGDLVRRFDDSGTARAVLTVADGLSMNPEIEGSVYRIVLESLTNARRYAPSAGLVEVTVRPVPIPVLLPGRDGSGPDAGPGVEVLVVDDGSPGARSPRSRLGGGFGLLGLQERVTALGGTFHAGHREGRGWEVRSVLPGRPGKANR